MVESSSAINECIKLLSDLLENGDSVISYLRDNNDDKSPITISLNNDNPQSNNITHSCRVFNNSIKLIRLKYASPRVKDSITNDDYLLLFYAALLHDFAKSNSQGVAEDINKLPKYDNRRGSMLGQIHKSLELIDDHGLRSAYYVDYKISCEKINLHGIAEEKVRQLLNIITFHSVGTFHPLFMSNEGLNIKEIFLCLLFWLADIADSEDARAISEEIVDDKHRDPKSKSRLFVGNVEVCDDKIIWEIGERGINNNRDDKIIDTSIAMANKELSKNRLLLASFGLPYSIDKSHNEKTTNKHQLLDYDDIFASDLSQALMDNSDIQSKMPTLVISAESLPELYNKVIYSFYMVRVMDKPIRDNYFGPVILQVEDVNNDKIDEIKIRHCKRTNLSDLKIYTRNWLSSNEVGLRSFYFPYTHGQRISNYPYPKIEDDLGKEPNEWSGKIDQLAEIVKILKKDKTNARRAYAVIPNPLIDIKHYKMEAPPSLISVHFLWESNKEGNLSLSGFAFLRCQELSLFMVINYLEIKDLINKVIKELKKELPNDDVIPGRIVMISDIGYFDYETVLLDKPELCRLPEKEIVKLGQKINDENEKQKLIEMLKEFGEKEYIKVDIDWCQHFRRGLPNSKENRDIRKAIRELEDEIKGEYKKSETQEKGGIQCKKLEGIRKIIEEIEKI